MRFVSYAQNFEDVMLWRALNGIDKGFYIDVGANDPIADSVTKAFYERGWRGINIEPLLSHWHDLERDRPDDINLQCAVGEVSGELELWETDTRGWATAAKDVITQYQKDGHTGVVHKIPVQTLTEICSRYVQGEIHFLKIDVEGYEYAAISGMDFSKFRPWILVIEAAKPSSLEDGSSEWEPIVLSSGYVCAYKDGLNCFYVAAEHSELLSSFTYPPNVFDDFVIAGQLKANVLIEELQVKVRQAETKMQQAETKAQQAETKAQQAEMKAQFANDRLNALVNSRSWRITAPMRFISKVVSHLKTKALKQWLKLLMLSSLRVLHKFPGFRSRVGRFIDACSPALGGHLRAFTKNNLHSILNEGRGFVAKPSVNGGVNAWLKEDLRIRCKQLAVKKQSQTGGVADAQPLLSLCITTYNRAKWLRYGLTSLMDRVRGYEDLIEVVICDNASTDDTPSVVDEFSGKFGFKYFRNTQNVGMLGNLGVTARHATGKFVWIIGDDDILLEGAIESALMAISEHPDIEFIYTNYSYTHHNVDDFLNYQEFIEKQVPITEATPDIYVNRLIDIAANSENFFTAIYCCIFRADHALAAYNQDTSGRPFTTLLTCVPTTQYVLDHLLDRPAYWLGQPTILVNMNVSWGRYADLWILERFPEMYQKFEAAGVPSELIDHYRNRSIQGVEHYLRHALATNSDNLQQITMRRLLMTYRHLPTFQRILPSITKMIEEAGTRVAHFDLSAVVDPYPGPVLVEGPFVGSYSLAIVNRMAACALAENGGKVGIGPSPTEGVPFSIQSQQVDTKTWDLYQSSKSMDAGHVTLRYTYPPTTENMKGCLNVYHSFGWEESDFPLKDIEAFNRDLDGITVMTTYVRQVLIDHGLNIPVYVTGLGVDHLPRPMIRQKEKASQFTFLHVSSCFPRKGVDVLLRAYLRAFNASDNVRLVIKTFPNPHNNVIEQLKELKIVFPDAAPVEIINQDWQDMEKVATLYADADVVVAPSRGEGFGLPIAESLWMEKPVIATGFGGQMDILDEAYPWLIDYDFQYSDSHFDLTDSYWADPDEEDLIRLLREARASSLEERLRIAQTYKKKLESKFLWKHVAKRTAAVLEDMRLNKEMEAGKEKRLPTVGVLATWKEKCGIAEVSTNLLSALPESHLRIFAPHSSATNAVYTEDAANVKRSWRIGDLGEMACKSILAERLDTLVIQYQPSFFPLNQLRDLVHASIRENTQVILFLHNVINFVENVEDTDLQIFTNYRVKIYVHSVKDLNYMKARSISLIRNSVLFPLGSTCLLSSESKLENDIFTISTFGFLLPHKGVAELIKAFAIVHGNNPRTRLRLFTALLDERSSAYADTCWQLIDTLKIGHAVEFDVAFHEERDVCKKLSETDLIVMPYINTTESASGAIKVCLSSGTPVICSQSSIFEDVARIVGFFERPEPNLIATAIEERINNRSMLEQSRQAQLHWIKSHDWKVLSRRLGLVLGFQY